MAVIRPFRAVRPDPAAAPRVAAVPYDVVDTEEARALAAGNPLSFLHVSRAEIDLPAGHRSARRYRVSHRSGAISRAEAGRAVRRGSRARAVSLSSRMPTATARRAWRRAIRSPSTTATSSRSTSARGRTRKTIARGTSSSCGRRPVPSFWRIVRMRRSTSLRAASGRAEEPLVDFTALDGVRHAIWRVEARLVPAFVEAFTSVDALYIADGHHRAASAARARDAMRDSDEANFFLAVAFPSDQLRILPYNRVVRDLKGMTPEHFLGEVARTFAMTSGPATPSEKGNVSMYVGGQVVHGRSRERGRVRERASSTRSTATCCRSGC